MEYERHYLTILCEITLSQLYDFIHFISPNKDICYALKNNIIPVPSGNKVDQEESVFLCKEPEQLSTVRKQEVVAI